MTHWKPYRVLYRQGYHYFGTLDKARAFIKNFESNKIQFTKFVIEKLNKEKFKSNKYPYAEIYDNYEAWMLSPRGWHKMLFHP